MASKGAFRWAVPLCAVAALGLGALTTPAGATAIGAAPGAGAAPAVSSPAFPGRLTGVTAISANDVWAVGLTAGSTLALHWNGSTWAQDPGATQNGYFVGVAASSAKDVWAVGGTNWFSPSQPLADHFNGTSWTRVGPPNPAGGGYLNAVAATSTINAWAVGHSGPGPGDTGPTAGLIEHWNGKHWVEQSFPASPHGGAFSGVAATSAANAWAVGFTGPTSAGTGQQTMIDHWNGKRWTRVPSPNLPGASADSLSSVTVSSSSNAWAVGSANVGDLSKTLILHWDGTRWTIGPSSTPGGDSELMGVVATWTNNIWAVGMRFPSDCGRGPQCQTVIEHWNSKRWKVLPSPNPPSDYLNMLFAASATSRGDIWAVGTTDYSSTLIVHWNGNAWS
jgi:hypothetical protein